MDTQELKRITSIIDLDAEESEEDKICKELRPIKTELAVLEAKKKKLEKRLKEILDEKEEELFFSNGIKAMQYCLPGAIDWKKIPEINALEDDYINKFRKKDTYPWKITAC